MIKSYDFNGILTKVKTIPYTNKSEYNLLTASHNSALLSGIKFNDSTNRKDFSFFTFDKNLNTISKKEIPFEAVLIHSDPFVEFHNLGYKPIFFESYTWLPIVYNTNRSGSNLILAKLNQSLELELIKPIISNIPQKIASVALRQSGDYLYISGLTYKGAFFYRMDKMGNFK
jgi:hypothetical protein